MKTKLQVTNNNFGCSIDATNWCCDVRFVTDCDKQGEVSVVLIKDGKISMKSKQHEVNGDGFEMKSIVCELLDEVITNSGAVEYWDSRDGTKSIDAIRDAAEKYIDWMFDDNRLGLDEIETV